MSTAYHDVSRGFLAEERALSPAEAADFLGISVKTLNNWRSLGKGPSYVKYGSENLDKQGRRRGSVAYLIKDLRAFRDSARVVISGGVK